MPSVPATQLSVRVAKVTMSLGGILSGGNIAHTPCFKTWSRLRSVCIVLFSMIINTLLGIWKLFISWIRSRENRNYIIMIHYIPSCFGYFIFPIAAYLRCRSKLRTRSSCWTRIILPFFFFASWLCRSIYCRIKVAYTRCRWIFRSIRSWTRARISPTIRRRWPCIVIINGGSIISVDWFSVPRHNELHRWIIGRSDYLLLINDSCGNNFFNFNQTRSLNYTPIISIIQIKRPINGGFNLREKVIDSSLKNHLWTFDIFRKYQHINYYYYDC